MLRSAGGDGDVNVHVRGSCGGSEREIKEACTEFQTGIKIHCMERVLLHCSEVCIDSSRGNKAPHY